MDLCWENDQSVTRVRGSCPLCFVVGRTLPILAPSAGISKSSWRILWRLSKREKESVKMPPKGKKSEPSKKTEQKQKAKVIEVCMVCYFVSLSRRKSRNSPRYIAPPWSKMDSAGTAGIIAQTLWQKTKPKLSFMHDVWRARPWLFQLYYQQPLQSPAQLAITENYPLSSVSEEKKNI